MKKIVLLLSLIISINIFFACSENSSYDDSAIKAELADHEKRITIIENMLSDYAGLTSDVASLKEQNSIFSSEISELKTEYETLSAKIQNKGDASTTDLETLSSEITSLKTRVSSIESIISNYETLSGLIERVDSLETFNESVTAFMNSAVTAEDFSALKTSLESVTSEISELKKNTTDRKYTMTVSKDHYITVWADSVPEYSCLMGSSNFKVNYYYTSGTFKGSSSAGTYSYDFRWEHYTYTGTDTTYAYGYYNKAKQLVYYKLSYKSYEVNEAAPNESTTLNYIPQDPLVNAYLLGLMGF